MDIVCSPDATKDGKYEITVTDAGIFLSVWGPAAGGSPVSRTVIQQELAARKCTNFDSDFISTVIREALGIPVLIVSSLPPLPGHYQITETGAGVYLSVWAPAYGGDPVSKAEVIQDLKKRGYTNFDSDFIASVIREAIGTPVQVVSMLPPINGHYQITATDTGVYLSVWAPANGGEPVSKFAVIQDLIARKCTNFDRDFIGTVIREALGVPVQVVNSMPPLDGHYQITATDVGVYLSVWAPAYGGQPVSKTTVIQDLIARNCTNFDSDFISTVIHEAIGSPVQVVGSLPAVKGHFQITATDAGVYLSVWAPANGGAPVSRAAVIQELTQRNFVNYDSDFIAKVIKEAIGAPVLIVNSFSSTPKPTQSIRVKVALDRLEARIDVSRSPESPPITLVQLWDELQAAGVIYGIDEAVLESLVEAGYGSNIVCARGIPPSNGEDAYLKYHVDPDSQGRPVELEDGRVDFKEINSFLTVEEGQLLVEKIPATQGVLGMDVFGAKISPRPGRDIRMPVGKNVVNVDDWRLYAAIDGHLNVFLDKRINVIPVIIIDGDVDYATGNIEFKGSVIVKGSVQPDFTVKAGGNVEVWGTISGGMVEAANIIVRKGIQGMNRGVIKARERLVANFIENATVYADQDVIVNDAILNSSVFAGMRVMVEGRRGLVRGGRISAGEVIRASTVGNQSGVNTELEVSANPFLKEELLSLSKEIKKAEVQYEELKLSVSYIRTQGTEQLSKEKRERYQKHETDYNALTERLEEMRQRVTNIEELLNALKPGRIRISGLIYPGAKVSIGSLTKVLNQPLQFISFYALGGEIKFSSLR